MDGAESSALRQLEKIRAKKEALKKSAKEDNPQETTPRKTQGYMPPEEMSHTPGRKERKSDQTPEDLEYEGRLKSSWSTISSGSPATPAAASPSQ